MAFFCDENDLQIDDNLFEFWGAFCDPHELDDAFAATTTSNALPTTTSSSSSSSTTASTNTVPGLTASGCETSIEQQTKLSATAPIVHCQANHANGAHSSSFSSQYGDNISTDIGTETPCKPSSSISITGSSTIPDDSILLATVSDDETFSSNGVSVSEILRDYSIIHPTCLIIHSFILHFSLYYSFCLSFLYHSFCLSFFLYHSFCLCLSFIHSACCLNTA